MTVPIVHHPDYVAPLPDGHRFPMNKYGMLMARLDELGLVDGGVANGAVYEPVEAPRGWLELVHAPAYVSAVCEQRLGEAETRRIGFPVTARVARRSRLSAAGTVMAGRLALEHGLACQTAGGSHHAHAGFGSGFCVFNDVAVAAAVLRAEGLVRRVLVVDLDVHQGDGTAAIFADDPSVFTLSVHCAANFPARKQISDLDVGLANGTDDAAYLATLDAHLPAALARHRPDLVFYNAGVDPHEADKLGRLALTDTGIRQRDRRVLALCHGAGIPVATVVGGGYGDDKDRLARLHGLVVEEAAALLGTVASAPFVMPAKAGIQGRGSTNRSTRGRRT